MLKASRQMPAKFGFKIQLALARGETFFFKEKHCCVSYFLKKISVGFFYLIPYLRKQCTAAPQITLKPLSRALKRLLPSSVSHSSSTSILASYT